VHEPILLRIALEEGFAGPRRIRCLSRASTRFENYSSRKEVRPMKEGLKFKIASILFRVVGYGAVALAVYFVIANTVFWVRSESAIGKVVAWEAMEGIVDRRHLRHNIDPAKATVVEFETSSGETIVFASKVGSGLDLYEKGEEVTVLYLSS